MVDTADRRGWVSEPDSRGTMSILYTCFLTIVLCTWTAVHLDIPPRRFSAPRRIWQKARWMVAAILAPEYITFYAVVQREGVNWAMRRPRWPWPWSRVHTFYAVMGGIELYFSDDTSIRPSFDEFCRWTDCGLIEVPLLSTEEIEDKSKGNCFTKALALLQILWFATQLVTRAIQRLEVTPLELLTAGIVVCSLVTYIAWWEKPYDVDGPTRIQLGSKARFFEPLEVYRFSGTSADSKTDQWLRALRTFVPRFTYAILEEQDFQVALHPGNYDYRGFPSFLDGVGGTRFREIMLGESCASITSKELRWWRRHQSLIRNMYECERRTLISHDTSHVRRRPFTLIAPDDPEESVLMRSACYTAFLSVLFSACHITGWNSLFPTPTERILWRLGSIACGVIPTTYILVFFPRHLARPPFSRSASETLSMVLSILYILTRVYLLVAVFISFRSVPASVFEQVEWSGYIPHLG